MPNEQRTVEPTEQHSNDWLGRRLHEAMAEDTARMAARQELEARLAASYLMQSDSAASPESMQQRMMRHQAEREQTDTENVSCVSDRPLQRFSTCAVSRPRQSTVLVTERSPFVHPDTFNTPTTPEVGMGATVKLWDESCFAATIISVNRKKSRLTVKRDTSIMCFSNGPQFGFRYEPNPAGMEITFTKRRNGAWIREKQYFGDGKNELIIGRRAEVFLFVVENQA